MAEYEAYISTDENIIADVSGDVEVPVTVSDGNLQVVSVNPDATMLSIDAETDTDEIIDVPVEESLGGISSDHRRLLHRDANDQHPISAITGLSDALNSIESTLETRILDAENDITDLSLVEEADRIEMANAVIRIDRDISLIQNQVDGNITTWFYAYAPSTANAPASDWISAGEEAVHLGDLFYNTTTGYAYRWMSNGATPPTYEWQRITDTDVTKALADAAAAQDTADHKRRVFITTPTVPYDAGDLWFVGISGDILTCTHGRTAQEYYDAGDWSKLHKYTDDTRANAAYDLASNAKVSADGKNRIFRQNSQPTGGVYGTGDVWFDTAHDNKIYRYDGSSWVAVTLGDDALASLSADKITAGTIDASQITVSNLDAGNITTGYLSADRIKVDDIIADNSIIVSGDDISSLTNDSGFQTANDVSGAISSATSSLASKSDSIASTVSIYYRKENTNPPTPTSSTTIGTSNNTSDAWEYVMPAPKRNCTFYTCEKYTKADNSVSFSTVRELASETYASKWVSANDSTYIDGGRLYANSVTADQIAGNTITANEIKVGAIDVDRIDAESGTFDTANIPDLNASKITAGDISADRMKTNAISAINADLTSATINTAHIPNLNANKITAGDISADRMKVNSISAINGNTGTVKISADKVNIEGATIFTSGGRLSEESLDNAYAAQTAAVSEEQRIYYRSSSSTKPNEAGLPTAWVTETGNKYNSNATTSTGWSRKVSPIANGTGESVTKYLYLWTCIQKKTVSGDVTYGDILLDDSTTVIDGGTIITNSITANEIASNTITSEEMAAGSIVIGKMDSNTVDYLMSDGLTVKTTYSGSNIVFSAVLTSGGEDVTSDYPTGDYEWFLKTQNGTTFLANGRSYTMAQSDISYGQTVYCVWSRNTEQYLLNASGNKLLTSTGAYLMGRTEY